MKLKLFILLIMCLRLGISDAVDQGRRIFLIDAAEQGNLEIMRWLIRQEANLDVQDDKGNTPLMYAVNSTTNQIDMIELLLEAGADMDIRNEQGKSVFHIAIEKGLKSVVIMLEDRIKNISITDNNGRTGLHIAAMTGNEDITSYLATKGINLFDFDNFGFTALHSAAMLGRTSIVRLLRDNGMNLNFPTATGSTPLILASLFERIDTVKFIVESGGNINSIDGNGWSALHSAAYSGNMDMVKVLVENKAGLGLKNVDGRTPLYLATSEGHFNVSKYLTDVGSDISTADNYKNNIIHATAHSGNLELLKFFYDKGVPINNININGNTPLLVAAERNNQDVLKFLIDIDADKTLILSLEPSYILNAISTNNTDVLQYIEDSSGSSIINNSELLHHAAKHSNLHMINYLLQLKVKDYLIKVNPGNNDPKVLDKRLKHCLICYKAVLKEKDSKGKTPLHYAVINDNLEAIDVFIRNGVNQSVTDNNGQTAFHLAAALGRTDILHKLATNNPDLNALDRKSRTAIYMTAEFGHLSAMEYLIDIGADMFITDMKEHGLFHVAFENEHKSIVEALMNYPEYKRFIIETGSKRGLYDVFNKHMGFVKDLQLNISEFGLSICKAVEYGYPELIEPIYKNEKQFAKIECNENGQTLFHLAAIKTNGNLIEKLMKLYPSMINHLDRNKKSASWYAVEKQHWDTLTELELHGGIVLPNSTIVEAVDNNDAPMLKYLIKKGGDVNTLTDDQAPILFRAGVHGYLEIAKILVEAGANLEATYPGELTTTVHIASNKGNCEVAEYLLQNGAKVNNIDKSGSTALDDSRIACRQILLKYGAKSAKEVKRLQCPLCSADEDATRYFDMSGPLDY